MARVLVCGDPLLTRVVACQHLAEVPTSRHDGLDLRYPRLSTMVRVVVACLPTIRPEGLQDLLEAKRTLPWASVILVTSVTSRHVRALASYPELLEYVTGLDELGAKLRRQVDQLLDTHYLEWAAEHLTRSSRLSPIAARFILRAWQAARPPLTVERVARDIGGGLTTLREQWPLEARPKAVVDWGILGAADLLRRSRLEWPQVAHRLGVTTRRLERICERCARCGLDGLDERGDTWLEARFMVWLRVEALTNVISDRMGA